MSAATKKRVCRGTTKAGKACKASPLKDADHCAAHAGLVGAPSKFTESMATTIIESVANGNYTTVAAQAAGIHPTTLANWREKGEADLEQGVESDFASFVERLTRAIAEAETVAVDAIRSAFSDDWRAAMEFLKRKKRTDSGDWGSVEKLEHSGPEGGPIRAEVQHDLSRLSVEELEQYRELLAKANAGS